MPVTFGSVGDIISILLLIKDVIEAFDSIRGAAPEYQELTRGLLILKHVLLQCEELVRGCSDISELNGLVQLTKRCAYDCGNTLQAFLGRMKRYDKALSRNSKASLVKKSTMKIKWRMFKKGEISRLRDQLAMHATSLNITLSAANLELARLNQKKISSTLYRTSVVLSGAHTDRKIMTEVQDQMQEISMIATRQDTLMISIHDQIHGIRCNLQKVSVKRWRIQVFVMKVKKRLIENSTELKAIAREEDSQVFVRLVNFGFSISAVRYHSHDVPLMVCLRDASSIILSLVSSILITYFVGRNSGRSHSGPRITLSTAAFYTASFYFFATMFIVEWQTRKSVR